MTIPRFFSLFLYVVTFDNLAKVKQGHSQMGSISILISSSMTNNPWKFHACTPICTIIALIRPTIILYHKYDIILQPYTMDDLKFDNIVQMRY